MTDGVLPPRAIRARAIRAMNDHLRKYGLGGRTLITQGIAALGSDRVIRILAEVRAFATFDADNDPHDEHDFGALEVEGLRIFWKIDYYDSSLTFGSPDPSDPKVTERVMTVMLGDEY